MAATGKPRQSSPRGRTAKPKATTDVPLQATSAPLPIGCIDILTRNRIAGWAWNPLSPDQAVTVEILDGNDVVLSLLADQHRADLATIGIGDGRHGFSASGVSGLFPLSRHRIRVRLASNGVDLAGSPAWLQRETSGLDRASCAFLENLVLTSIETASNAEDLGETLAYLLRLLNYTVNAHISLEGEKATDKRTSLRDQISRANLTDWMLDFSVRLLEEYPSIHFYPSDSPRVSIIIPVYNKFSYTYNCLKSIQNFLPKADFEIIIVDDCSNDETLLCSLIFSGAVRVVRNQKNLGFVGSCNAGAAVARGDFLFFLNNDTLVRDGWLDELVETFNRIPNIGIAGSKLLFEDGQLQEAGGIIWRMGDGWNWGRHRDPNEPRFNYLRDVDWVSGAALMIPTALFNALNGFDKLYEPAYYEDTDLAFRVREAGKRVVMQPTSIITHLEGVSAGTDTAGTGMKRYQLVNHGKFYRRWKDTLATHRFNGEQPELEAERGVKRRAIFIDDTVPTPDQDAGSNAAFQHMLSLIELGYKVTFLPSDNMAQINPYTTNLQRLGIECLYAPFYWSVEEVFRKTLAKPDLIYIHRYSNASKYASMVRRYFPGCRVVYNVADLHYLRTERQAAVEANPRLGAEASELKRRELEAMRQTDCVIVHSDYEAALLGEIEPFLPVQVVPWTTHLNPVKADFARRSGIAFVGGFRHPPNVDAARHLSAEIMPLIRKLGTGITAYLFGSNMPQEVRALQASDIEVVGYVPVLSDAFRRVRCSIVPLRYGAGVKGKVLESLAHGIPCVMTEIAAEGLALPADLTWLVGKTPGQMAEKLVALHEDRVLNIALSKAGLEYIGSRYSSDAVRAALAAAIFRGDAKYKEPDEGAPELVHERMFV